jgi:hypothetical protein
MWIWWVLLAIGTFVIAAASIGWTTGHLAMRPRRSVYDLAEAVEFVADRLPPELTAELSFDDVEAVLALHCDYLTAKGIASHRTAEDIGEQLVVVADDEPVAWILGRLDESDRDLSDEQVVAVLRAEQEYYEAIGAIGPAVGESGEVSSAPPQDPDSTAQV